MIVTSSRPLPRIVVNFSRAPEATVLLRFWTLAGSDQSDWAEAELMPCSSCSVMPESAEGCWTVAEGFGEGVTLTICELSPPGISKPVPPRRLPRVPRPPKSSRSSTTTMMPIPPPPPRLPR